MDSRIALIAALLPGLLAGEPVSQTLPASMIGAWGWDAASCADVDSDGRVAVEPMMVMFYAGAYKLKAILAKHGRTIRATALHLDEGVEDADQDTSEHEIRLELIAKTKLRISADGFDHTYRRCKK